MLGRGQVEEAQKRRRGGEETRGRGVGGAEGGGTEEEPGGRGGAEEAFRPKDHDFSSEQKGSLIRESYIRTVSYIQYGFTQVINYKIEKELLYYYNTTNDYPAYEATSIMLRVE